MSTPKAKTLDGKPTRLDALNTSSAIAAGNSAGSKISQAFKNLSSFMAGMYTGVGCSGTPNTHHSYDEAESSIENKDK